MKVNLEELSHNHFHIDQLRIRLCISNNLGSSDTNGGIYRIIEQYKNWMHENNIPFQFVNPYIIFESDEDALGFKCLHLSLFMLL